VQQVDWWPEGAEMKKENTFTYTARSADNPDKMAMFTLHNGSVSIQLGNALLEQVEEAYESFRVGDDRTLSTWIKPLATGSLQQLLEPIPLKDFDAELKDDTLQTTAWLRAGGLRLAPVMMNWKQVDNPAGAEAFMEALDARKQETSAKRRLPNPFDYWAGWVVAGIVSLVLPLVMWRLLKDRMGH
jgi:hypothetical protein